MQAGTDWRLYKNYDSTGPDYSCHLGDRSVLCRRVVDVVDHIGGVNRVKRLIVERQGASIGITKFVRRSNICKGGTSQAQPILGEIDAGVP